MRKVRLLALWLSLVVCIGRIDGKSRNDDEDDDEPSPPPKSSFRNPFASFGNDAAIWSPYLNYFPFGGFGSGARNAYRPYYATSPFLAGGYGPPGHRPIGPIMSGGRAVSGSNSYAAPPVGAYMPPYRPIGIGSRPYPASLSSSSPFMPYGPPPPYRSNPTASKEKDAFEEELAKLGINLADFGLDDKKEKKPANPPKSTPTINAGLSGSSAPISYNPFATTNTAPQVLPSSDGSSNYGSGKAIPDTSNSALDSDLANLGIDLTKFGIGTTRSPLEQFLNSATGGASMSGTPLRGHDGDMNQLSELNKLLAQLNGGTGNGASLSSSPNSVYPADSLHQQLNALRQPHLNDAITSPHHSHHSHHHSFPSSSHQGQSWNGQSRAVMPIFTHNDQYFRGEKKHLQNFKPFTGKVVNSNAPGRSNYFRNTDISSFSSDDFFNSNKFDSARTKNGTSFICLNQKPRSDFR